jgi:hypothetical protein
MSTDDPSLEPERSRAHRPLTDAPDPDPPPPRAAVTRRRPSHRTLETVLLASAAALLAAVAWPIATQTLQGEAPAPPAPVQETPAPTPAAATDGPTIQIALLLDTSGSMDGLIHQARSQLWRVVNALDSATYHGDAPRLEIAVYEYGNDRLASEQGWIRQVTPFSSELDLVSEALFGLTTNGGDELAGMAIEDAVEGLAWREGSDVLRVLYIAGNEAFDQGPVDFRAAIAKARSKGIVVNTINCVGQGATVDVGWAEGAVLGGGKFLRIDQDLVEQYIATPYDAQIEQTGELINRTYVAYGYRGKAGLDNLTRQDTNSVAAGKQSAVQRALTKGSGYWRNEGWDLVDALESEAVDLGKVDRGTLAPELRDLDEGELEGRIHAKAEERRELQKRLSQLQVEREAFVTAQRARDAGGDAEHLDDAIIGSIVEQATAAGFNLDRS